MDRTNSTGGSSWLLDSIVGSPQPAAERAGVRGHREVTVAGDLLMYLAADATAQVLVQPGVGFPVGTCSSARRRPRQPCRRRRKCLRRGDSFYFKPFSAFDNDRRSATRKATPKAIQPRKLCTTHSLRSLKTFPAGPLRLRRPLPVRSSTREGTEKMLADPSRGDRRRPGRVHQSPLLPTPTALARQLPACGSRCLVLRS